MKKVLPDGTLDVDDSILKQIDYPIFAFHSFPKDIDVYLDALYNVLKNPYVNTWAHPGAFLKKAGLDLPENELSRVFKVLRDTEILVELNAKYNVPSDAWMGLARHYKMNFVRGNDCHRVEEFNPQTAAYRAFIP